MKDNSLEEYRLLLGKLATMITLLETEQSIVIRTGILNIDESELADTITWNCKKLMTSIGDQFNMVSDRIEKPWDESLAELKEALIDRETDRKE